LVGEEFLLLRGGEIGPARHLEEKREPVGERGIERFGAEVGVGLVVLVAGVEARRRIHGGPAVAEFLERDALDAALVDDGEELVLEVGARAAQFVDEDDLRVPDRGGGADVAEGSLRGVGHGDADEVVVVEERRVVEAVGEPEGLGETLEQEALGGAVAADEQQRFGGREGGEQDRLEFIPAEQPERPRENGRRGGRCG